MEVIYNSHIIWHEKIMRREDEDQSTAKKKTNKNQHKNILV